MKKIVLIDTNLYLDDSDIIFKLSAKFKKILIPLTVLKELDKKKYNKDLSYSARNAIQAILDFTTNSMDQVIFDTNKYGDIDPDDRILASAKKYGATVATKDIHMSITARSIGLESMLHDIIDNDFFDPYIHVDMADLHNITKDDIFTYKSEYVDTEDSEEYQHALLIFSKLAGYELNEDHWWFVIITTDNEKIIYANNPLLYKLIRIDNSPKYREINIDKEYKIKALDVYQTCAIYSMIEAPNTLICGSYGSGKSLLSTAYGIAYNDNKTLISRPNLTVDSRFALGFLPGSLEEKLSPWMTGVMSSLYHIYSNTRCQITNKAADNYSYDYVKEQVFRKYFEMVSLETVQGVSFMEGDLLLLDEAQLCSIPILSTILSRFGKGSKLIMTGDLKQTYNVIKPSENGLLKLTRMLPNKYMAYVVLKTHYRSELTALADKLQDKSI